MTWGEFKRRVEEKGLSDDTVIQEVMCIDLWEGYDIWVETDEWGKVYIY